MGKVSICTTPEPHYIPGYSGYVPQYNYNFGGTYGQLTHKLLVHPQVSHSERLVLSDSIATDYELYQPTIIDDYEAKAAYSDGNPNFKGDPPNVVGRYERPFTVVDPSKDKRALKRLEIKHTTTTDKPTKEVSNFVTKYEDMVRTPTRKTHEGPEICGPTTIYRKHSGINASYCGHIPGTIARPGRSFEICSTNPKVAFQYPENRREKFCPDNPQS